RQPAVDGAHGGRGRAGLRAVDSPARPQVLRQGERTARARPDVDGNRDGDGDGVGGGSGKPVSSARARIADSAPWLGRLMLAPAVVYILALVGLPFLLAVIYSFTNVSVSSAHASFVGLGTFRRA